MQQSDGKIFEIDREKAKKLCALLGDEKDAPDEVMIGNTRFFRQNTVPKVEEPDLNRHERRQLAKTGRVDPLEK